MNILIYKLLNRKVKGFSGITHILIAIFLLFILLYIKIPFSENFIFLFKNNWKFIIVSFFTITGAALLPDLDSARSTARFQLGFLGSLLKTGMTSLSYLATKLTRMKKDWIPDSQHRCLWHTPFIGGLIGFLFWKFIPESQVTYLSLLKSTINNMDFANWFIDNLASHICIFMAFCSIYLGVKIISFRVFKIFPNTIQRVLPLTIIMACFYLLLTISFTEIKYIGVSISLGYLFHIFGDIFTKGSIPILWPIPIPWKNQWWWRPQGFIFGKIETGGILNIIINYILLALNLFIGYLLFIKDLI